MTISTPEAAIPDALALHMAEFNTDPAVPVSYPNVPFSKPDGRYLETSFMPNRPRDLFVGEDEPAIYAGLYQIKVYSAARSSAGAETGTIGLSEFAGLVGRHFKRGTAMTQNGLHITVTATPRIAGDITEADRTCIPVTVSWQAMRIRAPSPAIQLVSPTVTDDGSFDLIVLGAAGAVVELHDGSSVIAEEIANSEGIATFELDFTVGAHVLWAQQTIGGGLSSLPGAAVSLTVTA